MRIDVAKIGKTVGTKGYLKLHILTDFPKQIQKNLPYKAGDKEVVIEDINSRFEVKFKGYNSLEEAKALTNLILSLPKEEAIKFCELKEGEYLWEDILNLKVYEKDIGIGVVKQIQRMPQDDHLLIELFVEPSKRILLPFNKRTIIDVDLNNKTIKVQGALDIIEVLYPYLMDRL